MASKGDNNMDEEKIQGVASDAVVGLFSQIKIRPKLPG